MTKPIDGSYENYHLRNTVQLTPNCIVAERCDAKKVTPKSVWRLHMWAFAPAYSWDHQAKTRVVAGPPEWFLVGYVRVSTTWRGKGFKANFWQWGDPGVSFSRWSESIAPTEAEADAVLIALGKGMWP